MKKAIRHHYGETQIMELNLLGIQGYGRKKLSGGVLLTLGLPIIILGIVLSSMVFPEIGFMAECINVPGGDVCSISLR